ncbi:hypothetical protein N1029_19320, partial [Herbiconiux sp. CPCC 203406]|uniref:hypothetical protein n=1 Tax=Herbiconiux oxytropis TaxID=2970915 RepID=UPI00217F1B61
AATPGAAGAAFTADALLTAGAAISNPATTAPPATPAITRRIDSRRTDMIVSPRMDVGRL